MNDHQFLKYSFLQKRCKKTNYIYVSAILYVVCVITLLPFIKVNISIQAKGIIRPVNEKTEIRSLATEVVEAVFVTENQYVEKDQALLKLSSGKISEKISFLENKHKEYLTYLDDLKSLTATPTEEVPVLYSNLYRPELLNYHDRLNELDKKISKAGNEVKRNVGLYEKNIISSKEFEDLNYNLSLLMQEKETFISDQAKRWNAELNNYSLQLREIESDIQQLSAEKELFLIKAPESGTIENFRGIYPGSPVQAGQAIAIISPDTDIVAEIYVTTKNIGYIKDDLKVKIQVDAFNYNKWGILEGTISSISNDYTVIQNAPVFQVKCALNKDHLQLKNGVTGNLKKGMSITARFIIARQSLLNLLYREIDDWLNPVQNDISFIQ